MNHPEAVVEKARRFEQVLFRVKQGEPLEELCQELDVRIDDKGKDLLQYVAPKDFRALQQSIPPKGGLIDSVKGDFGDSLLN